MHVVKRNSKAAPPTAEDPVKPVPFKGLLFTLRHTLSPAQARSLARRTQFQQRKAKKLTPWLLLQSACLVVTLPQISFRMWALLIGLLSGQTLSKQAFAERIEAAAEFLKAALAAVMFAQAGLRPVLSAHLLRPFRHAYLEDSSGFTVPPVLAALFPGPATHKQKPNGYLKLDSCLDLRTHRFVHFTLSSFRRNDQAAAADSLRWLKAGDLLIRDLGYFTVPVLEQISQAHAFFLSRWRHDIQVWEPDGRTPVDLLVRLQRDGRLDGWFLLGGSKVRVRIVAVPVSEEVANERRRKAKANRDKRCKPSADSLALMNWTILVTNVPAEIWSAQEVVQAYGLRWRVETIFKAWKSHLHLRTVPLQASAEEVRAIVFAKLLFITLMTVCWLRPALRARGCRAQAPSLLKLTQGVALVLLAAVLEELHIPVAAALARQLLYHGGYEKRRRRHFLEQLLTPGAVLA